MRASLSDGRVVVGYFGPSSFAAYGDQARDLFIEQQWGADGDGWFTEPAETGIGIWLSRDSIVSLELYSADEDPSESERWAAR